MDACMFLNVHHIAWILPWIIFHTSAQPNMVTLSVPSGTGTEGSQLTLTCQFSEDSFAFGWLRRSVSTTYQSYVVGIMDNTWNNQSCGSPYVRPDSTLYSYSCPNRTTKTLTVRNVTSSNHGEIWQCYVLIGGKFIYSNNLTISVQVPVTSVALSPSTAVTTLNVSQPATFECTVPRSLPSAIIVWYKNSSGVISALTPFSSVSSTPNSDGTLRTTGRLIFTPNATDNGVGLYCTASSGGAVMTSQQTRLYVQSTTKASTTPISSPTTSSTSSESLTTTIPGTVTSSATPPATYPTTTTTKESTPSSFTEPDVERADPSKGSSNAATAAGVSVAVALAVAAVVIVFVLRKKVKLCFAITKDSKIDNPDDNHHKSLERIESKPTAHYQSPLALGESEAHRYSVLEKDGFEHQRNATSSVLVDVHNYFVLEKQQSVIGNENGVSINEIHPYFVLEKQDGQPAHAMTSNEANPYFVLEKETTGNSGPKHTAHALELDTDDRDTYQEIDANDTYADIDDLRQENNNYDYTNKAFRDSNMEISDNVYNHLNGVGDEYDHVGKCQTNDKTI